MLQVEEISRIIRDQIQNFDTQTQSYLNNINLKR
jgi:hypothetical protein